MSIAKDGLKFILPALAVAIAFLALGWWPAAVPFLFLTLAFAFFFRDPRRAVPAEPGLIVSPADGKVLAVERLDAHPGLPGAGPVARVTIFLSLLDVHLTRAPLSGEVRDVRYTPGRFLPAYHEEAGRVNESSALVLSGPATTVHVKQIVGVAARRIKTFVRAGQRVERGARIGLMYFGSRVELTLPGACRLRVEPGARVKGGTTVIAEEIPPR
jgi:phosphatidylserine decarboxylase